MTNENIFEESIFDNSETFLASCYVTVYYSVYNEFSGMYEQQSFTVYLGEVENNGFGAVTCEWRARVFAITLYP